MKHLLLSLATTPERALRLLTFALDRLGPDCSDLMQVEVDDSGVITFSNFWTELNLPGANWELKPECRFSLIGVWLDGSANQARLVQAFTQQGGYIASTPDSAHLLVADVLDLAAVEARWPRKLVIALAEFEAQVVGDSLRPLHVSTGAPGSLPKNLRGIWNQLRSGSVMQILSGLDEFSFLVVKT